MTFSDRRRAPFGPELLPRVGLAWLAISILLLLTSIMAIAQRRFPDPDDALRLIQVRDLIAGQGWFDMTQHRVGALNGAAPLQLSRLVDVPIAGVILLLRPLFGQPGAEMAALVIVPLLTLGCALLLVGRIAWRLFNEEVAGLACLAMALSVPVIVQLRPMRIDDHGWQIVLALAAVNGLMARSARLGGWVAGLAIAAWLAISLEGLPLAAVLAGIAAWRWLRNQADRAWLINLMQGLSAGSIVLFLGTRGTGDLTNYCGIVSPVHLAMFAWSALVVATLRPARPPARTLAGLAVAVGGALAIMTYAAPQCAGGPFAGSDPVVRHLWYDNVTEDLPLWRQPIAEMLQIVVPPIFAILAAVRLAASSRDWLRRWWTEYTVLLCAALIIALFVSHAGGIAGALSAVPLGWQIRQWLRSARHQRRVVRKVAAIGGAAIALLPAMPLTFYALVAPAHASRAPVSNAQDGTAHADVAQIGVDFKLWRVIG